MDPVQPAYSGAGLNRVVPSLLGRRPEPWLPEGVLEAGAVVLFVLDGLGWNALEAHRTRMPVLSAMTGGPIRSVVPSTTASALTSISTGLTPAEHGVVGFRMRVQGTVLNVVRWQVAYGRRAPDPFAVQRHTAFLGRPVPVVTRSEFRHTGFTEAHLRGAAFHGWSTIATLVEQVRRLVAAGERFVYAYYPGVDTVAHEWGLHDPPYLAELAFADELVGRLLDVLPRDAALVVTSDHGQVHVGPGGWLGLQPLADLCETYAGEGRFRYLHARRGAAGELLAAAREELGGSAWVLSRDELLDDGWLGPGPVIASVRRRVGDVIVAARDPVAYVDPNLPREARLVATHGSLTPDEMEVPLLAAAGRAA